MRTGTESFTLIELMIVVIIVGILAAVAAPMMRKAIIRSKWSEAIVAISQIRTAERVYYAEYGAYLEGKASDSAAVNALGLKITDFDGMYFSNNCYAFHGEGSVECDDWWSIAPRANDVRFNNGESIFLYMNGVYVNNY